MSSLVLLLYTVSAIGLLLLLILRFKLNAFIALLLVSIMMGFATGMDADAVIKSVQEGMGNILGYIAVVVGLGAIFGEVLHATGGVEVIANTLLKTFGEKRTSWALMLTGFLVAIPVFFEVGFIILVPMVYALARKSGRSLLYYALPMLAGLAVTHAFIPPTPGPVAVAEIIDVPLGWVIIFGALVGLPTAMVAGPLFAGYISKKIIVNPPALDETDIDTKSLKPSFILVLVIIALPLVLILSRTMVEYGVNAGHLEALWFTKALIFLGHPFIALLIATLISLYVLGTRMNFTKDQLMKVSNRALAPAGLIILITGAGGVFKQVLEDSGVGNSLAELMVNYDISIILLAFILAAIMRITQGSATVAMISSAGLIATVMPSLALTDMHKALVVISIASGSTIMSHVNDSGFWLVCKYLNMTEKQALRSWTVMETVISVTSLTIIGFITIFI